MNRYASKMAMASALCGLLVMVTGCVSAMVDATMAKHGYHRATREQMLLPAKPSFPAPETRAAIPVQPKEKLFGKWTTSYVKDSRMALLSMGYDGPLKTMVAHQTYWLFDDGVCKMSIKMGGKETTWKGNWSYRDGILTISGAGGNGKKYDFDLKLIWYGETEFEARFADISQYENMLKSAKVKSVKCSCETNGVLHSEIVVETVTNGERNECASISVQSPQIYERDGDAE